VLYQLSYSRATKQPFSTAPPAMEVRGIEPLTS
jgi:hypothetical protein